MSKLLPTLAIAIPFLLCPVLSAQRQASSSQQTKLPPSAQDSAQDFTILTRRMDVDVDGAPNAYGPPGLPTLDNLRNAHYRRRRHGEIVGYLTDDDHPNIPHPARPPRPLPRLLHLPNRLHRPSHHRPPQPPPLRRRHTHQLRRPRRSTRANLAPVSAISSPSPPSARIAPSSPSSATTATPPATKAPSTSSNPSATPSPTASTTPSPTPKSSSISTPTPTPANSSPAPSPLSTQKQESRG